MENDLIKYLSKYITLTEEEKERLLEQNLIRNCKKDTILLEEGEVAKNCYLVLKGCVRSYYLLDGEEKITEFYTENQPITPVSYTTGDPSEYFLDCIEDCIISIGSPERTEELFEKIPRMKSISLIISSELLADQQISFHNYKNLPPEKRYFKLLETRPGLCSRVPQYMLASYLGIKPQSLSRIRKRISDNKI